MFGVQIALDLLATLWFVWCAGSISQSAGNTGLFGVQAALVNLLATLVFVLCAGSTGSAGDSGASKFPAPVGCHHVHVLASSSLCDENRRQRHNAGDFTYCPALSFSSARVLLLLSWSHH